MTIPGAAVFEDADLGKPLAQKKIVADSARTDNSPRNFRRPCDVERERLHRLDRRRQRDGHHRAVILIAVVRRDKVQGPCQIGSSRHFYARYIDRRQLVVLQLGHRRPSAGEPRLFHERGLIVPPGVVIQVELQLARGGSGEVGPHQRLAAGERACPGIETDINCVTGIARGSPLLSVGRR